MYLCPCLSPYSILVIAGLGGVCIYSCYSYCDCCRVAGAAIKVTSGIAIGTTYGAAVGIAGGISGTASRIGEAFYEHYCGHC